MSKKGSDTPFPTNGPTVRWLLVAAVLSTVVVALSIAVVLLVVHDARPETLRAWADAGQAFGAVSAIVSTAALIALIFTFAAQQHELKGQRKELQLQANSLDVSGRELRCSAETGLAMYHQRLLELTFSHPELGVVWPSWSPDLPVEVNQRRLYCNLILDGVWLNRRTGRFDDSDARAMVTYFLANAAFRDYWEATREKRRVATTEEGPEAQFFRTIDEAFNEGR
jgi:hypothetical protein